MRINKDNLAVMFVTIILGITLAIQFKTVKKTVGNDTLPSQRAQELAVELKKSKEEKELALERLDELEAKIEEYESGQAGEDIYTENLLKELEKYKNLSGYSDLEGPGVIIEIEDPIIDIDTGYGTSISDDIDLVLQLISVLNAADAEAISINDQRYSAYTEIEKAGSHLEVNGVSVNSPLIVKAIGDPELLESALSIKRGILWTFEYYDYSVKLEKKEKLEIPKYRKIKEFKYSDIVESDEGE